jgi:hypothetical protein
MLSGINIDKKNNIYFKFKRYLGRERLKWDDNIKMNLKQDVRV